MIPFAPGFHQSKVFMSSLASDQAEEQDTIRAQSHALTHVDESRMSLLSPTETSTFDASLQDLIFGLDEPTFDEPTPKSQSVAAKASSEASSLMSLLDQASSDVHLNKLDPALMMEWPNCSSGPPALTLHHEDTSDATLLDNFYRETVNVMSICNGPSENPWKELIPTMLGSNPVLFHAIAAMSALHRSTFSNSMKERGIFHMNASINMLNSSLDTLPAETALATTIALAFAESWDLGTTTGLDHIRAAKALIPKAHEELKTNPTPLKLDRFKFLCRTCTFSRDPLPAFR